jgi:hypothetical protein
MNKSRSLSSNGILYQHFGVLRVCWGSGRKLGEKKMTQRAKLEIISRAHSAPYFTSTNKKGKKGGIIAVFSAPETLPLPQ